MHQVRTYSFHHGAGIGDATEPYYATELRHEPHNIGIEGHPL